jgi:hypothetical protein
MTDHPLTATRSGRTATAKAKAKIAKAIQLRFNPQFIEFTRFITIELIRRQPDW